MVPSLCPLRTLFEPQYPPASKPSKSDQAWFACNSCVIFLWLVGVCPYQEPDITRRLERNVFVGEPVRPLIALHVFQRPLQAYNISRGRRITDGFGFFFLPVACLLIAVVQLWLEFGDVALLGCWGVFADAPSGGGA